MTGTWYACRQSEAAPASACASAPVMRASASATAAAITTISAHRVASSRYTTKNASPAAYGGSRLAVRARSQQLPAPRSAR